VGYLYFGIGLAQITQWAFALVSSQPSVLDADLRDGTWIEPDASKRFEKKPRLPVPVRVLLTCVVFLLLGAALPLSEELLSPHFAPVTDAEALTFLAERGILSQMDAAVQSDLEAFLKDGDAVVLWGRALYPRYYLTGQGQPRGHWSSVAPRDYNRVGFHLIGPHESEVVLALEDEPVAFPHAAEAFVLGCQAEDRVEALLVAIFGPPDIMLLRSPWPGSFCP